MIEGKKNKLKRIHALLQAMPQQGREQLMLQLQDIDSSFAVEIDSNLTTDTDSNLTEEIEEVVPEFDCLQNLEPQMIQKVFRSIEREQWLKALKIVEPEFKTYLLKHLSVRVRADLAEDLRVLGPVRLKDAMSACDLIIKKAWEMEKKGEISGLIDDIEDPWMS